MIGMGNCARVQRWPKLPGDCPLHPLRGRGGLWRQPVWKCEFTYHMYKTGASNANGYSIGIKDLGGYGAVLLN